LREFIWSSIVENSPKLFFSSNVLRKWLNFSLVYFISFLLHEKKFNWDLVSRYDDVLLTNFSSDIILSKLDN
jgi:hypothetical protein